MPGTPYRKTPYYSKQKEAGATFVQRPTGWISVVHYGDPVAEHHAVRNAAGTFDVHTQGELLIQGKDAVLAVQRLYANNLDVPVGRIVYTEMCNENGGSLDDCLICRLEPNVYMVVNTPSVRDRSVAWIKQKLAEWDLCATITDVTSGTAYLEVHGPSSRAILQQLTDTDLSNEKLPYMWGAHGKIAGIDTFIARSGYTGELGYELYFPVDWAEYIWDAVHEAGQPLGLRPCGVTALLTLGFEKAYMGYGRDINEHTTPYEAGIGWTVKLDKPVDFVGKAALAKAKAQGIPRLLKGFAVDDGKTVADAGARVSIGGKDVGETTKAGFGLTIQKSVGLAFVPPNTPVGTKITIHNKAGDLSATVVERPFYDPAGKRLRM
ncbi:MAG: aminomethyl transferase family protein [Chloroflexi bacterium]|nr:aminomethyl transferase family protein [Chloroflexota bacterium]